MITAVRLSPDTPRRPLSADMWDRIEAELESETSTPAIWWQRYLLPLAAALVLISIGSGFLIGRITTPAPDETIPVTMRSGDEAPAELLRYNDELQVFVVDTSDLPQPQPYTVYQIWTEADGAEPVSVGIITPENPKISFAGDRDQIDRLYVTIESGPTGSTSPTDEPMAEATLHD